ncbi:MAG: hypothetical protein H0V67_08625 [Geodermatophilaceae bacterium]|nr:hypothetical protein [Geodermatophilaceae bacterium]
MVPDEDALRRLIQGLSRGVLEGHVKNLRDHNGLRQLVASGAIEQREVNEAYRSYAREVSGEYGRKITDLSVRYYSELLEAGNEYSRQFYERVMNGLNGTPAAPRAPLQPIPLEMYGHLGGRAVARFELSNEQPAVTQVSFVVSPLRGPGYEVFRPIVMIDPQQFQLVSGAVQTVTISIVLEPSMFVVGHLYSGTVEVLGFPDVALALTVWAADPPTVPEAPPAPPVAAATPPAPAATPAKPARKRQPRKAAAVKRTAQSTAQGTAKKAAPGTRTRRQAPTASS